MTHTLHRMGSEKDFEHDIVVMMMAAKGFNKVGSAEKKKEFLRTVVEFGPVNYGEGVKLYLPDRLNGKDVEYLEQLMSDINDNSTPVAVFDDYEKVKSLLRELKEKDLGLSVIVSGDAGAIDLIMHSPEINSERYALEQRVLKDGDDFGVYGNNHLLPNKDVVKIHSMCGHGMISHHLIERVISDVKLGRLEVKNGVGILERPCSCCAFNKNRAESILEGVRLGRADV